MLILTLHSPCISNYTPPVCEICHFSDHDNNSWPCYIYTDDFATLTSRIEIMTEQQNEFANYMQKHHQPLESNLKFTSLRLDVNLCDDGASLLRLESG